jgi:hypothetical protein
MAPVPGGAPKKKVSPVIWVLVGVVGLFLMLGIVVIAGGIFVAKKIADNPALAAATALAAANPDVEVVSNDPNLGTVTFRDKRTGKTVTLDFEQIKEGRMVFTEDGKEVSVEAGESGLHIKSSDGQTVQIGADAKLPSWIPSYPGTRMQGTFSSSGDTEDAATATFTSRDSPERVLQFYAEAFKKEGLKVNETSHQENGSMAGGVVTAESEDRSRQASVTVSTDRGEVSALVTYSSKR